MGRMKTVVLLLVALLCLEGVWALKCHNCVAAADTCSGPMECPPNLKACLLRKRSTLGQYNNRTSGVAKYCVQSCENPVPYAEQRVGNILELDNYIHCCTTDLCNGALGRGLGATVGIVLLALVLVALMVESW